VEGGAQVPAMDHINIKDRKRGLKQTTAEFSDLRPHHTDFLLIADNAS
jgi:hypothetical protein